MTAADRVFRGPTLCRPYDGEARLDRDTTTGVLYWARADTRIHVSRDYQPDQIRTMYDLTEGCRPDVLHGDLRCGDNDCEDDHR